LWNQRLFCLWHSSFHIFLVSFIVSELFLISVFNLQWNAFTFQLLNETTLNETVGFFEEYAKQWQFPTLLVGTILLLVTEFLLFRKVKKNKNERTFVKYVRTIVIVLSLGLVSIEGRCFSLNPDVNYSNSDKLLRRNGYWKLYQSILMFSREKESINFCIESQKNIQIKGCRFKSPNIVLIIGETFNKNHSSLYGYGLNTNPLCSSLDGVLFTDVISPMNATTTAFKYLLSFAETDNNTKWCDSPLFPALFKSAGYNVVFYSNQYVSEGNLDYYDASAGFFNHPLIFNRLFNHRNHMKYAYDMELIEDYKQNRNYIEKDSNNLIIFHLHGQHSPAVERYPTSFSRFHEGDIARPELSIDKRQYIAEYDNATLYNDSVVWKIVEMYQDKDAIVIYLADHGEEVYDFRDKAGRFFDYEQCGADLLHNQLDIPFVVFETDRYKEAHPEVVEQIELSRNNPFMIDYYCCPVNR